MLLLAQDLVILWTVCYLLLVLRFPYLLKHAGTPILILKIVFLHVKVHFRIARFVIGSNEK